MRSARMAVAVAVTAALTVLGPASLISATASSAAAAPASGPWPETDYNAAASRANVAESTLTVKTVNLQTGTQAWSRPGIWQPERGDLAAPTASHLYAVDPAGQVTDLNPHTGTTQRVLTGATQVLAVDHARAYAICGTGHICAYRTSNGTLLWNLADRSAMAAEAGGSAGVLYLSDGKAVSAASGAFLRQVFTYAGGAGELAIGQGRIAASLGATTLKLFGLPGS